MIQEIPPTPPFLEVARRVVWFKEPADTLKNPVHFLAHVMTYGTLRDLRCLAPIISPEDWHNALKSAPAGIFDDRSWAYWNLKFGTPEAPLPVREL